MINSYRKSFTLRLQQGGQLGRISNPQKHADAIIYQNKSIFENIWDLKLYWCLTQKDTSGSWLKRWMEGWWAVGGKKRILWHHRLKLFISERISFRFFNLKFFQRIFSDPSTPTVYNWLRVLFFKVFMNPFCGFSGCTITFVMVICLLCQSLISFALWRHLLEKDLFCLWNKNTRRTRHVGTIHFNTSYLIAFTIQLFFLYSDFPVILAKFNLRRQTWETVKSKP